MKAVNGSRIVIIERKEESQDSNHINDLGNEYPEMKYIIYKIWSKILLLVNPHPQNI